jgi:hypothetical protein
MIAYNKCPTCDGVFRQISYNINWFEEKCDNIKCLSEFSQFHRSSFTDNDIYYCRFSTGDFFAYAYKDHPADGSIIHVFHTVFPRGKIVQSPVLKLPLVDIDFKNLDKLNQKWKLLDTFR